MNLCNQFVGDTAVVLAFGQWFALNNNKTVNREIDREIVFIGQWFVLWWNVKWLK